MSKSLDLESKAFSQKLSDKIANKLRENTASSTGKKGGNNNSNNTKKASQNTDKKSKNSEKPSNKKNTQNKATGGASVVKDKDLAKDVGDLIDSLGFNNIQKGNKQSGKKNNKKDAKIKDRKDQQNGKQPKQQQQQQQQQQSFKKEKSFNNKTSIKKENNDHQQQQHQPFNKENKSQKPSNTVVRPKKEGGALKDIDNIVTTLENTLDDSAVVPSILIPELHKENKAVFDPRTDWYNLDVTTAGESVKIPTQQPEIPLSYSRIEALHTQAKALLSKENEIFIHEGNKSGAQKQFLSQLLSAGTLSDKISAYTLLVQESPLHSVKYFNAMLGLCRKKSRGNALQSIAALKDMFINGVLPDRKLRYFKNQPTLSNKTPPEVLILWAFEDWLKGFFFSLVQILEILSHDTVSYVRSSTVDHILDLLKSKPEQEANLLRLGVNKLGDNDKQVASRVSYLILKIEEVHPVMNKVIADSVSELIFRPSSDYHARYYSTITLNQTILTHKNKDVANSLIRTYLSLFELLLAETSKDKEAKAEEAKPQKKPRHKHTKGKQARKTPVKTSEAVKEEEFDKLISAILTGMNRAYPFADLPKDVFESHINTIYRVTHSANFNTGIQALILLFQMSQGEKSLSDRFYRTLYESLLDPRLASSSKLRLYLNLMFKALKQDTNQDRAKAFTKRLIQVADHWINIGVISGVIYLISELKKASPTMKSLISDKPAVAAVAKKLEEKSEEKAEDEDKEVELIDKYDGRKRDPTFANAGKTKVWEAIPLLNHFHPTVSFYTQHYLGLAPEGAPKPIQPDLNLYTLAHFLDRFVYRNPKQKPTTHGSSIMQPLTGSDPTGLVFGTNLGASGPGIDKAVNFEDWKNMKIDDVDVGDRFFFNYFNLVQDNKSGEKKVEKRKETDAEDADLDDEQEIWKALVTSNPSIEAGEEDESDLDLSMSDMDDDEDLEGLEDGEDEDEDEDDDEEDDDSGFLKEVDDEDGVLGSDEEVDLEEGDNDDLEAQFEAALAKGKTNKRSRDDDEDEEEEEEEDPRAAKKAAKKARRQRLKDLPLFASAEDYAQYLVSDDEN
ncbi:uncharacterized protein SAPINGB_P004622 [Magnusiomyces paraingens]|uniref:CCAAT-binding factor domain-containing protein n=1 Tax=Magnusiomyces paraingens TaxID=2606893 RepID=A0A5E8BXY2_9ASCO|nr:uncharacterized protein SAPINGB_P004622 [Saprochaete ingens]VVT55489.1 unnamed protein product [Saprochaete ingens]